jgi:outer membrane protein assembly factor BamB
VPDDLKKFFRMAHKFHQFTILMSIAGLVLAACSSAPAQSWAGVVTNADQSALYIADNTHLYALSADGKTVLWTQPSSTGGGGGILGGLFGGGSSDTNTTSVNVSPVFADPAINSDTLVVSSYNKSVYGLNIKDGTQRWVFSESADRLIGGAAIHGDTVYVPSADNALYVLDLSTGKSKGGLWPFKTNESLWATPLVTDTVIYQPSMDHTLYALNLEGSVKWKKELNGALAGSPALSADGKTLYIGSLADTLYALNAEDGSEIWTTKTNGWVWTTPLLSDGTLYFGDLEGTMFALDATTGAEKWKVSLESAIRGTPALSGTTLVEAVDNGRVFGLDSATGAQKWVHEIDDKNADRLLSNLLVVGDNVIVVPISADQLVYALKVSDGSQVWTYKP